MYTLILIIKDESKVKKIVQILIELSLYNTTVLDGEGIENLAFKSIPLYSEIGKYFGTELSFNKTIITSVENRDILDRFIGIAESENIDLRNNEVAEVMIIPCEKL